MKKRFVSILFGLVMVLSACSAPNFTETEDAEELESDVPDEESYEEDTAESEATSEAAETSSVETAAVSATEETTEEAGTEEAADASTLSTEDSYDAFLNGEADLFVDEEFSRLDCYFEADMNAGDSYSYNDFLTFVQNAQSWDSLEDNDDRIQYIDCGSDGQKELVLTLTGDKYGSQDEFISHFIIQYRDGQYYLMSMYQDWSRSETTLYEDGYICGGGSNGVNDHAWEAGYYDADCIYHVIYTAEYLRDDSLDFIYFYAGKELTDSVGGYYGLYCDVNLINGNTYYSFYDEDANYPTDAGMLAYISECEDAYGITNTDLDTINQMIQDELTELGFEAH